jgi:hypothetical protein
VGLPQYPLKFLLDRRAHEKIHEVRIKLLGAAEQNRFGSFRKTSTFTVPATMCDRVEGVSDCDNPGSHWNACPLEPLRISTSIPSLVVRHDALTEIRIENRYRCEHVCALFGMLPHGAALLRAQFGRFMENVEERFIQFADVMKESDSLDTVLLTVIHPRRFG